MIKDDRPPSDPKARAAWDVAQANLKATQADQAAASARNAEEVERKAKIAAEDAEKIAREQAGLAKAKKEVELQQERDLAKLLATSLSVEEKAELDALEAAANGPGNPNPDAMRRLAQLRVRSLVKAKKQKSDGE